MITAPAFMSGRCHLSTGWSVYSGDVGLLWSNAGHSLSVHEENDVVLLCNRGPWDLSFSSQLRGHACAWLTVLIALCLFDLSHTCGLSASPAAFVRAAAKVRAQVPTRFEDEPGGPKTGLVLAFMPSLGCHHFSRQCASATQVRPARCARARSRQSSDAVVNKIGTSSLDQVLCSCWLRTRC